MQVDEVKKIIEAGWDYPYVGHQMAEGITVVEKDYIGQGRWETHYNVVIKDPDGDLWKFQWNEGSTEMQETEPPWEYSNWDLDPVEAYTETVTVTKYRPRI